MIHQRRVRVLRRVLLSLLISSVLVGQYYGAAALLIVTPTSTSTSTSNGLIPSRARRTLRSSSSSSSNLLVVARRRELNRRRIPSAARFMTKVESIDDSNFSSEDSSDIVDEEDVLDELLSPEMAFGMATRVGQEGATAFTDLAMARVEVVDVDATNETAISVVNDGDEDESTSSTTPRIQVKEVADTEESSSAAQAMTDASATNETLITEASAPSVTKILKFAIPAIGVWLCGPLLSLIDTSAVGLLSGTAQQAALNPAVAVTEYAALLIAFMYTATTNLIASSQGADQGVRGMPRTSKNFIAALQLSGVVGTALGSILLCLAVPLLRAIIGNDAIDPAVFSAALRYVRIRALGMPAAAIIGSSQAASLGMQDIKSPLYVLMAAAVINFLGDATLVGNAHPWIGGAAGAAWATVFSQYAAVALFVRWMCHHRPTILVDNPEPRFRIQKFLANHLNRRSTRGFLDGKFRARDFFQLPSKEKVADFTPYIIPVTSTQFGRISSYVAMSHVIASSLGTVNMAAQQVIISIWGCLYPVGESLSLTAQSFTPGIFETKKGPARTKALGKTLRNFWMAGAVLGTAMFGAVLCIPLMNQFFTTDAAVIALVHSVLPRLMMIFSTLGLFTASEGMLLGQKDLNFLGKCYASFFFIIPLLMLRLKRAALSGGTTSSVVTLKSVWTLFTGYQMFRTSLWMLRAMQLQRRTRRREEEEEEVAMSPSSQE